MDPRIISEQGRLQIVLDEMKEQINKSKNKTVWCTSVGDLVRWTQILAGERIWPTDMAGEPVTLCRECQMVVCDVYVVPRPKWGICGLCCKHDRKERTIEGSCKICMKENK